MYEITIRKIYTVEKEEGNNWAKVGQKEEKRDSSFISNTSPNKTVLMDRMGYTPPVMKKVVVDEEIYKQKIKRLNIQKVIEAVNFAPQEPTK